jgi:hypothetical protein
MKFVSRPCDLYHLGGKMGLGAVWAKKGLFDPSMIPLATSLFSFSLFSEVFYIFVA